MRGMNSRTLFQNPGKRGKANTTTIQLVKTRWLHAPILTGLRLVAGSPVYMEVAVQWL